jgi:hypothetical protein
VPGDELVSQTAAGPAGAPPRHGLPRYGQGRLPGTRLADRLHSSAGRGLAIFGTALTLLLVRLLIPAPVGQADNRDGPRLMCGIGLEPVTHHHPRFFRFAYFEYQMSPACAGHHPYPSSALLPLEIGRALTPLFGLPGNLNLIAVAVLYCLLTSIAIASLAVGLRIRWWAQLLVAAACWLAIADSAFFDVFGGPFSEPAALVGLMLVAAGVLYLGRGWHATVYGLVLAGTGGFLAILSKEQYVVLAVPVCVTLALAASRGSWRGLRRFRPREAAAGLLVAAALGVLAAGYWTWDSTSSYGQRLHHIQAVDMIFTDIVTNRADAPVQLRALGLPVSWAKYAGDYYWDTKSVRFSPLYRRYQDKLTDGNIAHYLVTHPGMVASVGQQAATFAQQFRITTLGDYPVSAGHRKGAYESRVAVLTWLARRLPPGLGLWVYLPLWVVLGTIASLGLSAGRRRAWHRDGAVLVFCMIGCAMVAFVPPAYFAGISTTRHMVGMNLSTVLGLIVAVPLAVSLIQEAAARRRALSAAPPAVEPAQQAVSPGPRR